MDLTQQLREMGAALIAGTGFEESQAPDMKGKAFFGATADPIPTLWGEFLTALNGIQEDKVRNARLMKVMKRVDVLADDKAGLVIGRIKGEFTDLTAAELAFIVSYLKICRGVEAKADETAAAPAPKVLPTRVVAPPLPTVAAPHQAPPAAPRRVVQDNLGGGDDEPAGDPPPIPPSARRTPVLPFDGGAWAGTGGDHSRVEEPEVESGPKPGQPKAVEHEVIDLDAHPPKGHGHHGAHGDDHAPAAPADTKGILKIVFAGVAALILLCTGSIGFLYWLFQ